MVVIMNHARLIGFLKKEHGNPAKGIPLFKQESDGWEAWPDCIDPMKFCSCYKKEGSNEYDVGRWDQTMDGEAQMAKRKSALVVEIIQGKTDGGRGQPIVRLCALLRSRAGYAFPPEDCR